MKIADKIVDLLTDKRRKVPLVIINFDYQRYMSSGEKGSCICNVHPELKDDEDLRDMLNDLVDHIRTNYDMKKLTEI